MTLALTGNRDGSTALDYTVNAAMGFPPVTGPVDSAEPVNHVLPAWDLTCGQTAALAAVAALGHVAEARVNGTERGRVGNNLHGAYGAEFTKADGVGIYVVGISPKQWSVLRLKQCIMVR